MRTMIFAAVFAAVLIPCAGCSTGSGEGGGMKQRRQVHNHPEMTPQEMARCRPASEIDRLGLRAAPPSS